MPALARQDSSRPDAIARAEAAIQAAVPRAQSDPARPIFHVASPAQWMNDPNGPVYYKGYYHLFYQLHPFSDGSGPKYWGHVRSRDLAKWEPLPIALWPSTELGETEVWSGCCTINPKGRPMIFYTSIAAGKSAGDHAEQWAALGDQDLITWRKSPGNPVLSEALHDRLKIYDWRDPFVFKYRHQTFLVTGGNLNQAKGGAATVNIYEAQNLDLTQWKYRGILFKLPGGARTAECPNFFKLGEKWVLFVSPYGKVQYYLGDFDPVTCRFTENASGDLDLGGNFYAPNTMLVPDGSRIVWGWVTGFPSGHGWNGCLTLPRVLSLARDGSLCQEPAPALSKLRGHPSRWRNVALAESPQSFALPGTNTAEIDADIDWNGADSIALEFKNKAGDAKPVTMTFHNSSSGPKGPLSFAAGPDSLRLRIFLDRSVLEIYANKRICATQVMTPLDSDASLEIRAHGGTAKAKSVEEWPMKTIWK